jgi:LPXTG-motif cell wall-anchored protein
LSFKRFAPDDGEAAVSGNPAFSPTTVDGVSGSGGGVALTGDDVRFTVTAGLAILVLGIAASVASRRRRNV